MIIGLTGGIGVGKSFVARCFKELDVDIFDTDSIVHHLYKTDKNIISYAEKKFPETVVNNEIDRALLSKHFLIYDEIWKQFQSLVHLVVQNKLEIFITQKRKAKSKLLVLDVPLLLEAKFYLYCNCIIFVHADSAMQTQRLSERNMEKEKLDLIFSIQLPVKEKRDASNFIIDNSSSKEYVFSQVKNIVNLLKPNN